mmetsp:Transcript_80399/g.181444  ORF Transcript_80399/g.181444 Transcript_80399/m.181444 type:complete len:82 (-) Transcript_80399:255-500(-)
MTPGHKMLIESKASGFFRPRIVGLRRQSPGGPWGTYCGMHFHLFAVQPDSFTDLNNKFADETFDLHDFDSGDEDPDLKQLV